VNILTIPEVTIGLVTWNSANLLEPCITGIRSQSYPNLSLTVVDNASRDQSPEKVRALYPKSILIQNPINSGFCQAHNQAIRNSKSKYYLALNPDVILSPDYLSHLVEQMELSNAGMVGGKLLQPNKPGEETRIDTTGMFIARNRRQFLRGHNEIDRNQFSKITQVFGIDGAAPLYRRKMLEDVCFEDQYFDETFFAHKEDVDLAWRARLFGWNAEFVPAAVAVHPRSFRPGQRKGLSETIRMHAVANRYLLLQKNEMIAGWRRDWPFILSYDLKILAYLLAFERSSLKAFQIVKNAQPVIKRWVKFIRQKSTVDPIEFLRWFTPPTDQSGL
jgi:GT2 family glycosyltransferase